MHDRLPPSDSPDLLAALRAWWAERRMLSRAARKGLDFTGATRPPRAAAERAWLEEAGRAEREHPDALDEPQGPRRRQD